MGFCLGYLVYNDAVMTLDNVSGTRFSFGNVLGFRLSPLFIVIQWAIFQALALLLAIYSDSNSPLLNTVLWTLF